MTYQKSASMVTSLGIILMLLMLSACSTQRVPEVMAIRPDEVPEFPLSGTLFIRNAQTDAELKDFGKVGVMQVQGDLKSWTQTAIQVLARELTRRGAKIDAQATTGLSVSVDKVEMSVAGLQFAGTPKGKVTLGVSTGSGYTNTYVGEYTSLLAYQVGDGAITSAVEAMLNDPAIRAFLVELDD